VTRDEFGGYCCKKWTADDENYVDVMKGVPSADDLNICQLLDLDIEKIALQIVKDDLK
jgi:hypothetical protein